MWKLFFSIYILSSSPSSGAAHTYLPKDGFIPDAATASKVAEIVLERIYGKEVLKQKPFKVSLGGENWVIDGSSPKSMKGTANLGGTAHMEISKKDGTIQNVIHSK